MLCRSSVIRLGNVSTEKLVKILYPKLSYFNFGSFEFYKFDTS